MFCNHCGAEIAHTVNFCPQCGTPNNLGATPRQPGAQPENRNAQPMSFDKSISVCFAKYVDFSGRASRPEFWWFYLFTTVVAWGVTQVVHSYELDLINLAFILPTLSAASRRLHDTGRSGWRQLWALTVIGVIPLIIWLASEGVKEANEYGNPP